MATFNFTGNASTAYGTGFDFLRDTLSGTSASSVSNHLTSFSYGNGLTGNLYKRVSFDTFQNNSGTFITGLNFIGGDASNASVQLLSGSGFRAPIDINFNNAFQPAQAAAVNKFIQDLFKGDDDFRVSGALSTLWGDYNTIASNLNLKLGDDTFSVSYGATASGSSISIYGDAVSVGAGASARGGNDFILAAVAPSVKLYGDFGSVDPTAHVTYGNDEIYGGGGSDVLYGDSLDPALTAGGNDYLSAGGGSDALYGGGGNDILNGGDGADVLDGGAGFDVAAYEGPGALLSTLVVDLQDNTLNTNHATGDVLTGIEGISGRDYNGITDDLRGDASANFLSGLGGNDILSGRAGTDTISGGAGADTLDGGADIDVLDYRSSLQGVKVNLSVNTASGGDAQGDIISNFESVFGSGFVDGLIGSNAANVLRGYVGNDALRALAGNDQLDGGAGADVMQGGKGNDVYWVDNSGDVVDEVHDGADGTDTVYSTISLSLVASSKVLGAVEKLTLLGTAAINAVGNSGANVLVGNNGSNILAGGLGSDILAGGAGADFFVFNTAASASNRDTIGDFSVPSDTIRLENAIFTAIAGIGILTAAQFVKNTTGLAGDANDRIIYESDTGKLFYDSNGNTAGGSVEFAKVGINLALTNTDFFII